MEDLNTIMKIRTATLNDLDALTAVEAECFPAAEAAERATGTGGAEYRAGEAEIPDCAGRTENPDGDAEAGTAT